MKCQPFLQVFLCFSFPQTPGKASCQYYDITGC